MKILVVVILPLNCGIGDSGNCDENDDDHGNDAERMNGGKGGWWGDNDRDRLDNFSRSSLKEKVFFSK